MDKAEFSRLKENGNKLLEAKKYIEAIEIFDEILKMSDLENEKKAVIFACRSTAALSLKTESSFEVAEADAKSAIQEWPRWWRGYYCLARVQREKGEWSKAEKSLRKALKYNPKSKEALKELGIVKAELEKLPQEEPIPDEMDDNVLLELFSYSEFRELNNPLNYKQFGKAVKEAARQGSPTAKRHLDVWKNLALSIEAFKKGDSAKFVAALSKAIHINGEIIEVPDALKPSIEKRFKSHPDELDTAVCYIKINTKNPRMLKIAKKYNEMFPQDEFLWVMVVAGWITFKRNRNEASRVSKNAIETCPESLLLLYTHAVALSFQQLRSEETLNALNAFLAKAPKDHEKVPSCYYRKAEHHLENGNLQMFTSSFRAGLAAEKKQLRCFLPYEYQGKEFLQDTFKQHGGGRSKRN